jgi:methyltransferase (TIGR00027 family)
MRWPGFIVDPSSFQMRWAGSESMSRTGPLIRSIADTARWAAVFRARETERPDALFRDHLAGRLAGELGQRIADEVPGGTSHSWAWVLRTYLFDQFISEQVEHGADMVVNLAAGLDARPYRMTLPPSLRWVEVDLPEVIDYKENVIGDEKPACALERIRMDLADQNARRDLFDRLGHGSRKALIVTEGIVIYLSPEEVGTLAEDLARPAGFQSWVVELASPGLLKILQQQLGPGLSQSGASLKFGPEQGPAFFIPHGWKPAQVRSMLKSAARMKRLSPWMWLLSLLPESTSAQGSRPWSGVTLLSKT